MVNFAENPSKATQYQIWTNFGPKTRTRIFWIYKFFTQTKFYITINLRKSKHSDQWTQHDQKCETPIFGPFWAHFQEHSYKHEFIGHFSTNIRPKMGY